MGNKFNLANACVHPSELCTQQFNREQIHQESVTLKKKKVKSTDQIKQKILKYVQQNRLQLYPVREKKLLETLVSVDQQHVSDKIVEMDKKIKVLQQQKRQKQRRDKNEQLINKDKPTTVKSQQDNQRVQQLSLFNEQLSRLKLKRKKLFEQAQYLLLQDLDMLLQQIPNFDQNYHLVNSILSLSQSLQNKQQPIINHKSNQNKMNQSAKINKSSNENFHSEQIQRSQTMQYDNETKHSAIKSKILHPLEHRTQKKQKKYQQRLKQMIRIQDKKILKRNVQIARLGIEMLKDNQLLMIVPVQGFSGIGSLRNNTNTSLPSGITLFQLLANKIKAVNMRRCCTLGLAFLVNQDYVQQLKKEIANTVGFEDYNCCDKVEMNSNMSNLSEANSHAISYHVIPYKNIWPSFNQQEKILLLNDNNNSGISFTTHDGDLIGFIEDNIQLKALIQKYQYIHFTNPNNMLSQIGDTYALGCLQINPQMDVLVKILKPTNQEQQFQQQLKYNFSINSKGFVDILTQEKQQIKQTKQIHQQIIQKRQLKYNKNRAFINTDEYYLRSRIFTTDSGPLKRLLMSRVTRSLLSKNNHQSSVNFYLHRSLSSIFYYKFTAFLLVQEENQFSLIKTPQSHIPNHIHMNGHIGYSRYCKKLLGLRQSEDGKDEEEMVEIDGGILHKGSQELKKILKELKKIKEVGFPIILYSNFFNNEKEN